MEMIKDLGMQHDSIDKRTGKSNRKHYGIFKCPMCGKEYPLPVVRGLAYKGCRVCRAKELKTKHNHVYHPMYKTWQSMKARCNNPNNIKYRIYGGAGIKVCERWNDSFQNFYDDNINKWKPGLTIDRIDSTKGYYPENVQWITRSENSSKIRSRTPVVQLTLGSPQFKVAEYESVAKAAEATGINAESIRPCLKKKTNSAGKFLWVYKEEYDKYHEQGLEVPQHDRKNYIKKS